MSYLLFLCLTQSLTAHPSIKILVCTWILTYTSLLNCVNFGQLDIPECISPWPEGRCHGVLEKFILVRNALFIFLHFLLATVHEHLGVRGCSVPQWLWRLDFLCRSWSPQWKQNGGSFPRALELHRGGLSWGEASPNHNCGSAVHWAVTGRSSHTSSCLQH